MEFKIQAGDYRKMGVRKCGESVTFTFQCPKEQDCAVVLFDKKTKKEAARIALADKYCVGSVRSVMVSPLRTERYHYAYEIDGQILRDPYGEKVVGREKWGDFSRDLEDETLWSGFNDALFDWGEDACPEIPAEDMVMYKLHIRGFTMDAKGKGKGTFEALRERLPYLKELGVTTVEVMPVYEFEEIIQDHHDEEKKKLNYWGYAKSDYFAVKASYARGKDAVLEFKSLVRTMHEMGMEIILEMHFIPELSVGFIVAALRHWVLEYHVDGFKLLGGFLPVEGVATDPYLSRAKIFYEHFPDALLQGQGYSNLYSYSDSYLYPVRKSLNHMNGDMVEFTDCLKRQHPVLHYVNYLTNSNTFTLADLFSYNEKHNMENGEENLDGNDWNYSANYGVEGASRRQFVKKIREKQMRNAMAVLCLSRGIPLILSGDEIGNSQNGNNNAYCQDNRIGWVNWNNEKHYAPFREFVKRLLAFRKAHPALRQERPFQMKDYRRYGFPDLSYHGEEAWIGAPNAGTRAIGLMYCEKYASAGDAQEAEDTFLYIGYNFYMGAQVFALPKLPKGKHWYLVMDTSEAQPFLPEPRPLNKNCYEAFGQTVSILVGK